MREKLPLEQTNMCMVYDAPHNQVVVQQREKYWTGYTFPGGHVEIGESFCQSAIREIREETGLEIRNLQFCGMIHWDCTDNGEQYVVYLYKTTEFSGELLDRTDEGRVFWMNLDDLQNLPENILAPNFRAYLKLFLNDALNEVHIAWSESDPTRTFEFL